MKVLPFSVMRAAACVWCALLMGTAAQEAPQRPEGVAETPWRLMTPAQRDAVADGMRLEAAALRALDQGRFKDARIEAGKALTALMSGLGADHPLSLDVRRTLAGCAEGLGEYLEAQSILRLMLLLEDSAATPDRRRRANACYLLAKALASGVQRRPKEYQPLLLLQARLYALRAVNGLRPPPGAVSTPAEEAACRPMQDLLAGLEAQIKTLPLEVREPPGHSKKTPEPSMTGQTPLSEAQTQAMTGMDHEVVEIMYRFDQDHDSQAALQALHAIQERYFQLLGKEGPLALARRSRVARMLCDAGSRDEALKELRAVLAVIHRRQQPPDFFTAFVEKSIVLVMRPEAGDTAGLREAELLLRDVLAIEDKVLPPLHTALFQTRALLINTLKAEDKVSGAMREFDRLMKAQQAASGVNDWAALETMRQSAMYCSPVPLLAAEGLVEVMSLYDTASHTNEDLRLAACHDLAGCLMRDKRPDEAHVMALRAWHGREEAFGTNDPRTAESLKLAREITSALASRLQSGLIAGPPKRDASGARTGPDPVKVLDAAVAKWRAMRLDELAELAAKGDGGAQLELASRYAGGEGVKQDLEVSFQWTRRSVTGTQKPGPKPAAGGPVTTNDKVPEFDATRDPAEVLDALARRAFAEGRIDEAAALENGAVPALITRLGADSPVVLEAILTIGRCFIAQGQANSAVIMLRLLLALQESGDTPDLLRATMARFLLAQALGMEARQPPAEGRAFKLGQALVYARRALEDRQRMVDLPGLPNNQEVQQLANSLQQSLDDLHHPLQDRTAPLPPLPPLPGAADPARAALKKADREDLAAADQRRSTALALMDLGKDTEAVSPLYDAIIIYERLLGKKDALALRCRMLATRCQLSHSPYKEGIAGARATLAAAEGIVPHGDPCSMQCREALATCLARLIRYEEAEAVQSEVVDTAAATLGIDNAHTLVCREAWAAILNAQGKHDPAMQEYEALLQAEPEAFGVSAVTRSSTWQTIANFLIWRGRHSSARLLLMQMLTLNDSARSHLTYGDCRNCQALAECCAHLADPEAALVFARRAVNGWIKAGVDHDMPEFKAARELLERLAPKPASPLDFQRAGAAAAAASSSSAPLATAAPALAPAPVAVSTPAPSPVSATAPAAKPLPQPPADDLSEAEQAAWWTTQTLETLRALAAQNNAFAQAELSNRYATGTGVKMNQETAFDWVLKAAKAGHLAAQERAGRRYVTGYGVKKDPAEGLRWLDKAARGGSLEAMFGLGLCYSQGMGTPKNAALAASWLEKAAQAGHVQAQNTLGCLYVSGMEGLGVDLEAACRWFTAAADQDDAVSLDMLATCYVRGDGVPMNPTQGVRLYRRAADLGLAAGQYHLATHYIAGRYLAQDNAQACVWLKLAAAQGHKKASDLLSDIVPRLGKKQLAVVNDEVKRFKPRPPRPAAVTAAPGDKGEGHGLASGTGFFITADGYLVTNHHVIKGAKTIHLVTGPDKKEVEARVVAADSAGDLAILKTAGTGHACLPVASVRGVKLGATVATVGFPNIVVQGFSPKLARGEIASLAGLQDNPGQFQISVPLQPGNSGGALVDVRGNVVGIVCAIMNQKVALATTGTLANNVAYAVKSSLLSNLIDSVPGLADALPMPLATGEAPAFEDVVADVEHATVLILVEE